MRTVVVFASCLANVSCKQHDVVINDLRHSSFHGGAGKLQHAVFASSHGRKALSQQSEAAASFRTLASLFLASNPKLSQGVTYRSTNGGLGSRPCTYRSACLAMKDEDTKGAIGGAVLGGLVAGPFGALWGAQLGKMMGSGSRERREQKEQLDRMGLSEDVVKLAQETAQDLANAESSLQLVQRAERSQSSLVRQLDDSMSNIYAAAEKALKDGDESAARSFLEQRQSIKLQKVAAQRELDVASQRVASMEASLAQLAVRATKIEQMVSRTVVSKRSLDISLDDPYSSNIEDPLEGKWRDLERR